MPEAVLSETALDVSSGRGLVERLPVPVLLVDRSTLAIVLANQPSAELTGYRVEALVDLRLDELSPRETTPWLELIRKPGLAADVHLRHRDGTALVVACHVQEVSVGGTAHVLLVLSDVTARRKLEDQLRSKHTALREAYRELELKNRQLTDADAELSTARRWLAHMEKMATVGRFAAGVAHEINNPMAFVMENLRRLKEHLDALSPVLRHQLASDPCPNRELLQEVVTEAPGMLNESLHGGERVLSIVRQIHSFSSFGEARAELSDPRQLAESALMIMRNQIGYRARLERHLFEVPQIHCIPGQIEQVLINLLANAVQATKEGDPERNRILIRIHRRGDYVCICVEDSGCGIAPEDIPRIMDPFFTTKAAGTGSGLGLAISFNIVKHHGGELRVDSELNKGTRMEVLLPIDSPLKATPSAAERAAQLPTLNGPAKILLVDDEPFLLRALKRSLGRLHDVHLAYGANEGLSVLAQDAEFDLIIADLMMPEINGLEFYERVKQEHPHLTNRMLFMSGGVFVPEMQERVADSGVQVLPKPFNPQALAEALEQRPPPTEESPARPNKSRG